jgi:solute carrier family 25 protein 33/36
MTKGSIIAAIFIFTLCVQVALLEATALPARAAVSINTSDPRKHSQTLTRGGARGGASTVAVKTMPAGQIKLLNLLSGGVAGTIASCITNPLEVIKTQLQSSSVVAGTGHPVNIAQRIMAADGLPGFFKGLKPTLIGVIPARSIYFYSYEQTKKTLDKKNILPEGSVGNALASGLMAGLASNSVTNPIWMVKTRVQLLADSSAGQVAYSSYRQAVSTIFKEEGIAGFYRGLTASYWGCTEGAIQFLIYERIKTRLLDEQNRELEAMGLPPTKQLAKHKYFCSAAVAKGFASILTYPHEVARTRLREQARSGVFKYNGMWNTIGIIGQEEGRSGLYAGMGVHLSKVIPNSAIMFLTYEVVNSWLSGFKAIEE